MNVLLQAVHTNQKSPMAGPIHAKQVQRFLEFPKSTIHSTSFPLGSSAWRPPVLRILRMLPILLREHWQWQLLPLQQCAASLSKTPLGPIGRATNIRSPVLAVVHQRIRTSLVMLSR